jgi:hypothetical protein
MPAVNTTNTVNTANTANTVETIVDLIRTLTPAQRRVLARRLRVSGLLQLDDLTTDRRRMVVAPALGIARSPAPDMQHSSAPVEPPARARASLRMAAPRDTANQPAISGHVVLGAPAPGATPAPHVVAPLPGQAPETPIVVALRGLVLPNGETANAEYVLQWPGYAPQPVQMRFSGQPTPDQALYDTLEKVLRTVLARLSDNNADPATARIEIYCPSDRFIDEVIDETPVADARLQTRHDRVAELLDVFGDWRLVRAGQTQEG